MRSPKSIKAQPGSELSQVAFIPAPLGGLNTRDPRQIVPITEATAMSGFFPTQAGLAARRGYTTYITTDLSATPCESLMVYAANNGTEAMFAAIGTSFYNVSSGGALGAAVQSGLTNARWQYTNFTNSAGTAYLCCFNGVDSPRYWNGSAWITITGASSPAITGLTTSTIVSAAVHQRRMWLVQVDSLKAWYLPIDSVGGEARALDLGGVASLGGYIVAIESWTLDGGDGIDDVLVCITSEGQLIAYRGIDPTSASTWELAGVWNVSPPVGRRSMYQYKGDVLVLTRSGILSAARVFQGDTSTSSMLSDKISRTYEAALASGYSVPDLWQLHYFPEQNMLIWAPGREFVYPMNTLSGAWGGSFFETYCWARFNGRPYFAAADFNQNRIALFWDQDSDDGAAISAAVYHGFGDLGQPGVVKVAQQCRLVTSMSTGGTGCAVAIVTNFRDSGTGTTTGGLSITSGLSQWVPIFNAVGVSFSPELTTVGVRRIIYNGFFITYQSGGILNASN